MAIIKCPECQNEVSDKAVSCPKCGYPIVSVDDIVHSLEDKNITVNNENEATEYSHLGNDDNYTENHTDNTNVAIQNQEEAEKYIECPRCKKMVDIQAPYCPDCGLSTSTMKSLEGETTVDSKRSAVLIIIGIIILICIIIAISFYSSYSLAKTLNSEIEAITTVNASDGAKLDNLRNRYNKMSDFQKKYITSYDTLTKAIFIQEALEVESKIMEIYETVTEGKITSDMSIEELENFIVFVETTKSRYDKLSEAQKNKLSEEAIEEAKSFDRLITSVNELIDLEKQRNSNVTSNSQSKNTYGSNSGVSGITLEKYEKIQNGMTYSQVVNILGSEGTVISSMEIAGITQYSYGWYGEYGVPMIGVVIQNGQVTSKLQVGLQ